MSDPMPPPVDEVDDNVTLEDLVDAFLRFQPTPTDQQLHGFAAALGIPYPQFEEQVFKMFGEELEQREDLEELMEEDDDLMVDDLDMFLVSFFLFVPEPTEEVVHRLAEMVDITPEEIEERVYAMLAKLRASANQDGSDAEDDDDEDLSDEDFDDEEAADDNDEDSDQDSDEDDEADESDDGSDDDSDEK